MAEDAGMRPVVLSASSVNAYGDCHLRWYFSYVLLEEGVQSEAQAVGIAAHEALEALLRGMRPKTDGIESIVMVLARDIIPTYREPVLIEAPFQIEINGIPYSGIIDSLDRQDTGEILGYDALILRDLKTTGSRPAPGKHRFALSGYWLGATDLGYEPTIAQLDWVIRTRTPYYWPEPVQIDDDDIDAFAATLERTAEGIDKGDYEPTGVGTYVCNYCPHQSICGPYKRYKEVTSAD